MRRLFDVDPVKRKRTIFHYEDAGGPTETKDRIIYQTQQDVEPILEYTDFKRNENTGRWGDIAHVARIPENVWAELERLGIAYDDKALCKWLDDSDHRRFRTKTGRLS